MDIQHICFTIFAVVMYLFIFYLGFMDKILDYFNARKKAKRKALKKARKKAQLSHF